MVLDKSNINHRSSHFLMTHDEIWVDSPHNDIEIEKDFKFSDFSEMLK